MHNKDANNDLPNNIFVWETEHLQKGQSIMYEGEEAEVISVKPFLVIKTKNSVVCGVLRKQFDNIREH